MSVQSVDRSLDLLEALAGADDLGLVELANLTGLQPSTAHRLLRTLAARGYVSQDGRSGRYLLSHRVSVLADAVGRRYQHLRAAAGPHLAAVAKVTGESAALSVLDLPWLVYVDQVEGSHSVRMFARRGANVLAHATAAGKAMLACGPPDLLDRVQEPMTRLTERTLATRTELEAELRRVRRRGFALDDQEQEVGVGCVAAAIGGADGPAIAALSVSAPMARVRAADPKELGELLRDRAAAVAVELGG